MSITKRSHPIRGHESNATLTPVPAATAIDVIDTTKGTVHMVIGGGASCSSSLFEHDLFGKPVSTFPDHALGETCSGSDDLRIAMREPEYSPNAKPARATKQSAWRGRPETAIRQSKRRF
jgi:hypothetical protein